MSLVYVDDIKDHLDLFGPYFGILTKKLVFCIQYKNQSLSKITQEILEKDPHVVILDYNLSLFFKGTQICRELRNQEFKNLIVGFSSIPIAQKFLKNGADGFILKDTFDPVSVVRKLEKI